jgi:hypothetical protein
MPFFATELAKHSWREIVVTATTAVSNLLEASSKPTAATATVAMRVVVVAAATPGGDVHRVVVSAAT